MQALCVDCHLDHTRSAHTFTDKVQTGVRYFWVQYITDRDAIDWEAKRELSENY